MEQVRRDAICEARRAGRTPQKIIEFFHYPKSTVYKVVKAFDNEGKDRRADHSSRADKIRTPRFWAGLNKSIDAHPNTPISKLAKDRNVHRSTIEKAIKVDLRYRSRARATKHLLTEQNIADRVSKGKILINQMKSKSGFLRFFSDEKIFTIDASHNRRNDRWICLDADEVKPFMKTKNPASNMVLAVISTEGDVMPPYFFQKKETVNKEVYKRVLEEVVVPWMDDVADGRPYTFQQDSAPAHRAKIVLDFLALKTPNFWPPSFWPANSPDLNPCDYYLWGKVEGLACKKYHTSVETLKQSIIKTMKELDPQEVSRACISFRRRVDSVVKNGGSHYE
ncbi:Transposable element tcb2 transposase [Caligus rogercresseyi]|uniref:Transposable element tcb2 transposase n=1 Tax=Caligus rogercresseyi TaxID=217165 RepID=A0A7T8H1R8_CALRO|nr:Transposable element tcb2 transposase [Caligus rogercresseyi]